MNLEQIKTALSKGTKVYWKNLSYVVIKDDWGQYFIECPSTRHLISLTWADNITLNGEERHFFTDPLTWDQPKKGHCFDVSGIDHPEQWLWGKTSTLPIWCPISKND